MRVHLALAVLLLLAGCTSSVPDETPRPPSLGFVASRVDVDGDGLYDAVNITLLAAPAAIEAERLAFRVDGMLVPTMAALQADRWAPGRGAVLPCSPGVHEFEVRLDGAVKKLVALECGVRAPRAPPFFQARIIDGDGDGLSDTIELTLLGGGPVRPEELMAFLDRETVRIYESPLKARLARDVMANGTGLFLPCDPERTLLDLTWRNQELPQLRLTSCQVFVAGVDVPLLVDPADVDGNNVQDAWHLLLGPSVDGPFAMGQVQVRWGERTADVYGSVALDPVPPQWSNGATLVIPCPGNATLPLSVHVRGVLVFRSVTVCEAAPGAPLLAIAFSEEGGRMLAKLTLSRLGTLDASKVTINGTVAVGEGEWPVGETRSVTCPGGELILYVGDRLAFRGPTPC